jgi:hypothetical protein
MYKWVAVLGAAAVLAAVAAALEPGGTPSPSRYPIAAVREPEAPEPTPAGSGASPGTTASRAGPDEATIANPATAPARQAAQPEPQGRTATASPSAATQHVEAGDAPGVPVSDSQAVAELEEPTVAAEEQRVAVQSLATTVERIIARAAATRAATAPDAYVQAAGLLRDGLQIVESRREALGLLAEFVALDSTVRAALDSTITVCQREAALTRRRGQAPECPAG